MGPPRSKILRTLLIYVVAAACLAWVFRGVHFGELLRDIRSLDLRWVAAALIFDIASTVCHGVRWRLLLSPAGGISPVRTTQALYAGLFANQLLPARVGEVVRGYLVSRWIPVPFVDVVPSMITERLFDGALLVLGLGVCAFFLPLPGPVVNAGAIAGALILTAWAALIVFVLVKRESAVPRRALRLGLAGFLADQLDRAAVGLRRVGSVRVLLPPFVLSVVFLSLQVVSFWLVMQACGLRLPVWAAAPVLIFVRLGTAFPNAPANIGPYQFFAVLSLTIIGVDKTAAAGFALVLSVVLMVPLWVIGVVAFTKSGLSLSGIRKHRDELAGAAGEPRKMV